MTTKNTTTVAPAVGKESGQGKVEHWEVIVSLKFGKHPLDDRTIKFCLEVANWIFENPTWRSPRGGVWEIIKELAGRRGLLPIRVAYLYIRAGQRHCEEFARLLAERGVRYTPTTRGSYCFMR